MRQRRLAIAVIALLVLATAWDRQPDVALTVDSKLAQAPTVAQAEVDLGALGTIVLGWTAKRLINR